MRRWVAVTWHASFSVIAAALYFFFVLPRWPELMGDVSHTVGTVLRIVTGAVIGLAALPVAFTLVRSRRPELGTPRMALTLRTVSIALHVLAAVLIIGTAVAEIWVSLDSAGQWLFGIYGAAAAVALLGIASFYLAFVAELPPPPPKPLRAKQQTRRRGRRKATDSADADETDADEAVDDAADEAEPGSADAETTEDAEADDADEAAPAEVSLEKSGEEPASEATEPASTAVEATSADDEADSTDETDSSNGKLQNRRPAGKNTPSRRRRRLRGGVAVED